MSFKVLMHLVEAGMRKTVFVASFETKTKTSVGSIPLGSTPCLAYATV